MNTTIISPKSIRIETKYIVCDNNDIRTLSAITDLEYNDSYSPLKTILDMHTEKVGAIERKLIK